MSDQSNLSEMEKKQESLAKEVSEFLKQRSAKLVPALSFPVYNKLPIELELALAVIQKHEPEIEIKVIIEEEAKPLAPVQPKIKPVEEKTA